MRPVLPNRFGIAGAAALDFAKDRKGLAAIEFALIASFLAMATLNVSDLAVYLYDELQVSNATQMGAQAAWAACDLNHLPATVKCSGLSTAIAAAVQSSTLGNDVTLQSGSPAEGYYCASASGSLQYMSDVSNRPADCTAAGLSTASPGDYIQVKTAYRYVAIFPGISVASLLPATITSSAWVRLGP
jgi:Flp pilus assembly protein TadG